jgi:POT family proton-dependent oligopeptide transporter
VSFGQRLQEIRDGFERAFWVANLTELFERLSYYSVQSVLALYLYETLRFSQAEAGDLIGYFGAVVWFLPILGGTLADYFGFRRSLSFAYLTLALGYFLLGSLAAPWMAPMRSIMTLPHLLLVILLVPALGPAIVKPCVVGTTARASTENVRSIGYSIYYTLVNIGGALGPLLASVVVPRAGAASVFQLAALFVFLMFFAVLFFFKEPKQAGEAQTANLQQVFRNFFTVVTNVRFMTFLLIFSGFYVVFWQVYIALPLFLHSYGYTDATIARILSTEAITVISLQVLVSYLTRKMAVFPAMTLGILLASVSWLVLAFHLSAWTAVVALAILALGEVTQASRYYEYISRLAPSGQQGTYMGFAFLPVAIGFLIAGRIGGRLVHYFSEVAHKPSQVWWVISSIGIATTLLMWLYHVIVKTDIRSADATPQA